MADLTHLDANGLQTFVDNDVADFIDALKRIREDDSDVKSVHSAVAGYDSSDDEVGRNKFLVIGGLNTDAEPQGKALIDAVTSAAKGIDEFFSAQQSLFKNIDSDLRETIKTLLKTQQESLAGIKAQELLDVFSNLDSASSAGAGAGAVSGAGAGASAVSGTATTS
ncbi:type VII secretion system-associated protein [Streptomyces canus]|uniref:type VII secretion system-associated protein n=1 Tax=Streptomyces canus TaxID=58343 RepID=UPI002785226E|nr:type VII secretion system-associated protein [Streptomyces canus]MDQ0765440.1 hypothetical protein [Streptomyces canus]